MRKKVFVDTNVFIYAFDIRCAEKRIAANRVISELGKKKSIVISTQILQEFYSVFTKKRKAEPFIAEQITKDFLQFEVTTTEPKDVFEAIRISRENKIAFWDALLFAAAVKTKCSELLTEDLNAGQVIQGVKVVNPFA